MMLGLLGFQKAIFVRIKMEYVHKWTKERKNEILNGILENLFSTWRFILRTAAWENWKVVVFIIIYGVSLRTLFNFCTFIWLL